MSQFFHTTIDEVARQFSVSQQTGLSESEAAQRVEKYGKNVLISKKSKSIFQIFIGQFKSVLVLILLIAAVISGVIGVIHDEGLLDTYIILGILLINAIIGTVQERKAEASLEALNRMSAPQSKVLRDGQVRSISSKDIVPGDVVILDTGDIIPADLRLIEAVNLKIQESALTGESVPVNKNTEKIDKEELPIGDRENMAFSTGMVTYGRGKGIVVATAMQTEVGKIADMLQNTEETETPMGRRLEELGKILGIVALAICVVIFVVGVLYGNGVLDMFMMAVSLAVAAIPESLQVISTIVLSMGVQRLVKLNAIVRTLPSVETLGSATVICSDKTGTLTQNKMTVVKGFVGGNFIDFKNPPLPEELDEDENALLRSSILSNDTHLKTTAQNEFEITGDPTETAIVRIGLDLKINKTSLEKKFVRKAEVPFDSERKRMSTINELEKGAYRVHMKGGLDEVLSICSRIQMHGKVRPITEEDKQTIYDQNHQMAQSALRVLAVAYKDIEQIPSEISAQSIENEMIFVGLLGMIDPARPEVIEAVKKCKTAGIRPVMITGDHKVTAVAIAQEIGLFGDDDNAITGSDLEHISQEQLNHDVTKYAVYARVAPEHKVRIVKAWQHHNDIVAMTGDGVNDAPALKQADIGVSMGIVGTEVAKDASDVILTDDNFATIVSAVEEGRRIYDNILKSIQFLLSANVGEVLLIFIASVFNLGNPLLPIHILWVNLVTDSLPALALSMDPAEKGIMKRKPRDTKKGIFTKGMTFRIIYQGIVIGLISLGAYLLGYKDGGQPLGQTMAFAVLAFSQLFHVRNLHSNKQSSFATSIFKNTALVWAILISALMMVVVLLVPTIRDAFSLVTMDTIHWLYTLGLCFVPIVVVEIFKAIGINHTKNEY